MQGKPLYLCRKEAKVGENLLGVPQRKMMNPQDERLDELLSQLNRVSSPDTQGQSQTSGTGNAEIDELVHLARRLQTTPHVRVEAGFAQELERRLLRHALTTRHDSAPARTLHRYWRLHRVAISFIGLGALLLLLVGTGLLVLALQTAHPAPPR